MITPQEKQDSLALSFEIRELYFKREDLHPHGSHKGRSIPLMIEHYAKEGIQSFTISSSGNAAISAALAIQQHNENSDQKLSLQIYVGNNINAEKYSKIQALTNEQIALTRVERPLQSLFALTQDGTVKGLRQSNDDVSLVGYETLAKELASIKNLKAVFIPTSSGTTAQALAQAFKVLGLHIEIHIVQTISCHPFADAFTDVMQTEEESIADAIVDRTALRREKLTELVRESDGGAYIANNEQIRSAIKITEEKTGLHLSPNSALSVAGLMQAVYTGKKWDGAVVCLITGK